MARFYYGGLAVIEGVMMRGRRSVAVAVRAPNGEINVHQEALPAALRTGIVQLPLVRGLVALWDMLAIGTRMLMYSAEVAAGQDIKAQETLGKTALGITTFIGMFAGLAIFLLVPVLLTKPADALGANAILSNVIEGVLRLAMFLGYIVLIGRMDEIKRVFAYHGAEHKTIHAFEAGAPLTVDAVRPFPLQHPRCGTGFLLVVAVLCIVVFAFLGQPPLLIRLLSRVVLIPLVAAVAYELLRLGANNFGRVWVRWLLKPGLALQNLTTREPNDGQLAVAIQAFQAVRSTDLQAEGETSLQLAPAAQ